MPVVPALLPVLSLFLISVFMTEATAQEHEAERKGPPSSYHLDDISVRFTRHPGNPGFKIRRITLSSGGGLILERDGTSGQFPFANQDLLHVVNELYQMRFFELPADYTAEYSVVQEENGILATMASSMNDESSTSVCIMITDFKKCVAYARKGPLELENLVERVFAKASEAD